MNQNWLSCSQVITIDKFPRVSSWLATVVGMVSKFYIRVFKLVENLGLMCTIGKTMCWYNSFISETYFYFCTNCSDQLIQRKLSQSQRKLPMIVCFFLCDKQWILNSNWSKKNVRSHISVTSSIFWTF